MIAAVEESTVQVLRQSRNSSTDTHKKQREARAAQAAADGRNTYKPLGPYTGDSIAKRQKNLSAFDRVKAFPNECLVANKGNIDCLACKKVGKVRYIVKQHCSSVKHIANVEELSALKQRKHKVCTMHVSRLLSVVLQSVCLYCTMY